MQLILHRGKIDLLRPKRAAGMTSPAGPTTATNEQSERWEKVPRWLWGAVVALALSAVGGLATGTTLLVGTVMSHSGTLIEHRMRLSAHDEKLLNVNDRLSTIDTKIDKILEQVRKP